MKQLEFPTVLACQLGPLQVQSIWRQHGLLPGSKVVENLRVETSSQASPFSLPHASFLDNTPTACGGRPVHKSPDILFCETMFFGRTGRTYCDSITSAKGGLPLVSVSGVSDDYVETPNCKPRLSEMATLRPHSCSQGLGFLFEAAGNVAQLLDLYAPDFVGQVVRL
ncbi:hypothetical protein VTK73DRAFT_6644 [Phialemonium thermophilum]|uniref:Uncharacterized protein n=1 Tax=Phialemonium thermophilum TaxID=223376 RepID=A0ABR3WJD0_9PEZI